MLVPNRDCPTSSPAKKPAAEKRPGKRSRKLMKAACAGLLGAGATLAGADAKAFTFDESAVGDFGDDFATANLLPPGVTAVTGSDTGGADYFEFSELQPGSELSGTIDRGDFGNIVRLRLRDSSDNPIDFDGSNVFKGNAAAGDSAEADSTFATTVPGDGRVVAWIGVGSEGGNSYTLSLDSADYVIPEPGAAGLAAMGAAALLGRRRKDDRNDA